MKKRIAFLLLAGLLVAIPLRAPADGESDGVYTVFFNGDEVLFRITGAVEPGDEYISADNQRYEIESVDEAAKTARAAHKGAQQMPDVNWLDAPAAVVVSGAGGESDKLIAMYSTHSDESYIPSDGSESAENGHGGIYDVCETLKKALEEQGIQVVLDESKHVPHDAGAYRRSRQTAVELMKKMPDALIDVHRDGIPDPDEYKVTIDGDAASKVRLLVGRSNQNSAANKDFALQIKAVADKQYPKLIKDIFIGKGTYNQDLMSNAILLEFGTHTLDKDRAMASASLMGGVLHDTLYGGVSGAAGGAERKADSKGAGTGIFWVVLVVAFGIGAFALLQTGGGKAAWEKVKRGASEATLGMIGKKKE